MVLPCSGQKAKDQLNVHLLAAAGKKKRINVGRSGGSAGLDDYKFDDALDVDDDFM